MEYPLTFGNAPYEANTTLMAKLVQDWKFILQLCAISLIAGGIVQSNYSHQGRIIELEKSNTAMMRTLIIIEERSENARKEIGTLRDEIQKLRERLEFKKIVGTIGAANNIAGEHYIESWQP